MAALALEKKSKIVKTNTSGSDQTPRHFVLTVPLVGIQYVFRRFARRPPSAKSVPFCRASQLNLLGTAVVARCERVVFVAMGSVRRPPPMEQKQVDGGSVGARKKE